jgi:hypothetical protein
MVTQKAKKWTAILLLSPFVFCHPLIETYRPYRSKTASYKYATEMSGSCDGIWYKVDATLTWWPAVFREGDEDTLEDYPWGPYYVAVTMIDIDIENKGLDPIVFDLREVKLISKYYRYKLDELSTEVEGVIESIYGKRWYIVDRDKVGEKGIPLPLVEEKATWKEGKEVWKIQPGEKKWYEFTFVTEDVVNPVRKAPHIPADEELILYIKGLKKGDKKISIPEIRFVAPAR